MTNTKQRKRIKEFIARWTGRGYEKGESQTFWLDLLSLLGVESPADFIRFEGQVRLDHTSFIDGFIPSTHVLIEQKSLEKNLRSPIKQSDGSLLTPFKQAKRYSAELPYDDRPRWIVTCNFAEFLVYDMNQPNGEPASIKLCDLDKELYRLNFLTTTQDTTLQREMDISLAAGELVGRLYDALLEQYIDPSSPHALHSLNALCVRLVFCLYAEDAGLFPSHTAFHDYLASFHPDNMRKGLIDLFKMLDTKAEDRDPYERKELLAFPYVNGGLFKDENIEIPRFTTEILHLILNDCSADFDWSGISPTIFGAVFESTLNPETRRSGGMHYTSIENIHKLIDPLFLDSLTEAIEEIESMGNNKKRRTAATEYINRIASLTFLDPACGSGNFLTETFLSLRRLENRALKLIYNDSERMLGGDFSPIKVSISQFYGIEINDFAATVAKTALWIAESQMMKETEDIVGRDLDFLPLKTYTNITEGNALRIDWKESLTPALSKREGETASTPSTPSPLERAGVRLYIMGNPPFVGARLMSESQKEDMISVFGEKWKNVGNMDYVSCWYKKAADMINGTDIRCALVSTNSITQGEQVPNLWKPLFAEGIHIDFAHRTFRWDSEAKLKAHVHCVIIGYSASPRNGNRTIFDGETRKQVSHINAYLIDAPDIFIESRSNPICDVPQIGIGNKPIDGGNYLFTKEEMEAFIRREPASRQYFKPWYGSAEFIHRYPRYCLWLGDCSPAEINRMPECKKRVAAVREFRLASKSEGTRKLADKPTRFHVENMPKGTYIVIPEVSSEKRRYVPMGFFTPDNLCSNLVKIIPNATLYHFGVLTSNVHMAWMRAVCGRLEMRYRYSKDIVYNNFPWPSPTDEQRERIEKTAQGVLDARALYPDSSLADIYDETLMPPALRKAHQQNDRAVMQAYGFPVKDFLESDCVARLMQMYKAMAVGV